MKQSTKLLLLRLLLGLLIFANMTVIFVFSAQSGRESDETSGRVTRFVAGILVSDFSDRTPEEQKEITDTLHPYVRKGAHMAEFGSLSTLILLFSVTFSGKLPKKYLLAQAATFLYACSDEIHQALSDARGPRFTDVLIDMSGALICSTVMLAIILLVRKKKEKKGTKMPSIQTTYHRLPSPDPSIRLRIALVADLHGEDHTRLIQLLKKEAPDLILISGDLMEDHALSSADASGYEFLRLCACLAPTYYSLGNHEIGCYHSGNPHADHKPKALSDEIKARIAHTGAILLDNAFVHTGSLCICGLTSGINGKKNEPDQAVLDAFAAEDGLHILLCHHPEYFVPYIQKTKIELTVCGHAHGGQWRILGNGIYSPGQGLFPRYTAGVIDGRCVISRGLGNHTHIPRIFNRRELVIIEYGK